MKSILIALVVAFVAATALPNEAMARRFGGGGSGIGMQRSMPPRATPPQAAPARPAAAPTTAAAGATAAAPKRSWMGPIAGLAAGLGIAALMSHLGMGAEFANMIMLALLAVAAFFAIRFLMRRFGSAAPANARSGMQFAGAGAGAGPASFGSGAASAAPVGAAGLAGVASLPASAPASSLPAHFDAPAFERIAKMIFIRMQTANDAADLEDLRQFTTPEVFAAARLELQERGGVAQRTDVVRVDAEVLDAADEADRQVVSVRFHGLIREEMNGVAEPFDEIWHLTKPADGSREWAIAGIQPSSALVS